MVQDTLRSFIFSGQKTGMLFLEPCLPNLENVPLAMFLLEFSMAEWQKQDQLNLDVLTLFAALTVCGLGLHSTG
jgi:hypothetical protein